MFGLAEAEAWSQDQKDNDSWWPSIYIGLFFLSYKIGGWAVEWMWWL